MSCKFTVIVATKLAIYDSLTGGARTTYVSILISANDKTTLSTAFQVARRKLIMLAPQVTHCEILAPWPEKT